ncbi:Glucose-1-phosphatase precursor [Raoultella planticola]|uniref:Glucose-1-phosphatase n=1 Tax=Raoultella planticola TaxID=575 RepID=A0A485AAG7_RAOPL|nr:Glucose-1-phosphatase precursor [Raoultella planticola]
MIAAPTGELMKIEYVYQSTAQLRNTETLTLQSPPQRVTLALNGCPVDANGFCPMETFKQVDERRGEIKKTDRPWLVGPGLVLLARSCAGHSGLHVFALDGLFAPEKGVFIRFREGQREHFIAAFFPNFSASFFIVIWLIQKSLRRSLKRYFVN